MPTEQCAKCGGLFSHTQYCWELKIKALVVEIKALEKELQEVRDNFHASQQQLRISAQRGITLQKELMEVREQIATDRYYEAKRDNRND